MIKIYSKIHEGMLLHMINHFKDIEGRTDLVNPDEFLQCATMKLDKKIFKAHRHLPRQQNEEIITQESFVIIQGKVKCIFYDLDDSIIEAHIIRRGDASFTFYGGHNYEILKNNTILYEFKVGKYIGEGDRVRI